MSVFNPKGVEVSFGEETRQILFDYNIIAEIQESFDNSVIGVLKATTDVKGFSEINASIMKRLLYILLEGEKARRTYFDKSVKLKSYTQREIGYYLTKANDADIWNAILEAWMGSLPETTDEDKEDDEAERELALAEGRDPNVMSGTVTEESTSPAQSTKG